MRNKVLAAFHMLVMLAICGCWGAYVTDAWGTISLEYALFCVTSETALPILIAALVPACLVIKGETAMAGLIDVGLAALVGTMGISLGEVDGLYVAATILVLGIVTMVVGGNRVEHARDTMTVQDQRLASPRPRSHVGEARVASHAPRGRH